MKSTLGILYLIVIANFQCLSQLNIHSITHHRMSNGGQYTLNGTTMSTSGRLKLLSVANFGPDGVYPKAVNIEDGFLASNSLTQVVDFPYNDLFFFGTFDKSDATLVQFTNEEIDSLYNWSKKGGKLIICGSAPSGSYNPSVPNSKWEFSITSEVPSSYIPNATGLLTDIFKGPFGIIDSANQGGTAQGYFSLLPNNVSILATDKYNHPTIIMDCATLDLIVADVDGYTTLSGAVSAGSAIVNDQDKYFANSIVFMDRLQELPVINQNGMNLIVSNVYTDYQWYFNDTAITGFNNNNFPINQTGEYYVETTMNGGCKVKSKIIHVDSLWVDKEYITDLPIIPNAFSPNNDGQNEVFILRGWEKIAKTFNIRIFNRWGEKVFETEDPSVLWDGTYKRKKLDPAVFIYYINVTLFNDKKITKKGNISLIK